MGINVLLGIMVYFFISERKGVSLEHIDVLFGGVDHVQAGEDIDTAMGKRGDVKHQDRAVTTHVA